MNCCNYFDNPTIAFNFRVKLFEYLTNYRKCSKIMKKLGTFNSNKLVLEVGGGKGIFAKYFVNDVKKIVILDPSEKMLDIARKKGFETVQGMAQKIPFRKESFDSVICMDSFHHFTNGFKRGDYDTAIDSSIKEMLRVLKRNGKLMICEFDISNPTLMTKYVMRFENKVLKWGSLFHTPEELRNRFRKYKVEIEIKDVKRGLYLAAIEKKKEFDLLRQFAGSLEDLKKGRFKRLA